VGDRTVPHLENGDGIQRDRHAVIAFTSTRSTTVSLFDTTGRIALPPLMPVERLFSDTTLSG